MAEASDILTTKMEFAVQMSCASCEDAVKRSLDGVPGVQKVYVNLSDEVVIVESSLPSSQIQQLLEDTGRLVVFRGFGGQGMQPSPDHHGAAVAILKTCGLGEGLGLARLVQTTSTQCVVEATVDGLPKGEYEVKVHEYGDLSHGCDSCGEVYCSAGESVETGILGTISIDSTGRATLQAVSEQFRVWDLLGRSIVVHSSHDRVMCGIIARSAGLFQNTKKLCTCDGVTIWDEARQVKTTSNSVKSFL